MSYVPVFEEKREWSDRTKKVKTPAISGYVFFEIERARLFYYQFKSLSKKCYSTLWESGRDYGDEIEAMKSCLKLYTDEINFKVWRSG